VRQNALEWVALAVSSAAIALVALLLVSEGIGPTSPTDPYLALRPEAGRAIGLGWSVPATLSNEGSEAAEGVVVEAIAMVGGTEETSEVEVMFLPGRSSVEVEFGFSAQPAGEIQARLVGYRVP